MRFSLDMADTFRMPPIDEERLRLFEACKAIWPNVHLGEQGQIWLPFNVTRQQSVSFRESLFA